MFFFIIVNENSKTWIYIMSVKIKLTQEYKMKSVRKGIIAPFDGTFGNYWPSIARLPNGGLAVVWSGGRRNHICPF